MFPFSQSSLNFLITCFKSSREKKSIFGCESISIKAELVTFFLRYGFKEAFDIIALGDHIDKNIVLFPRAFVLVVVYKLSRFASVEPLGLVHVFFLFNVLLFSACEGSS